MGGAEPAQLRERELVRLMETYEKDMLRMCILLLKDTALAEDVVQETFLKAYRKLDTFRGKSSEKTWLMRIAINNCKDVQKSAWNRLVDRRVTMDDLPEPIVQPAEENVALIEEILRLPGKERAAILLYYYQGMGVAEMAQALRISNATVSKRLKRARAKLRCVLEGDACNE